MKHCNEIFVVFKNFKKQLECFFNEQKDEEMRTDNVEECLSNQVNEFLNQEGISHQLSVKYTPQHNGISERMNRTLVEIARCMLVELQLPENLWTESINAAIFVRSRCLSSAIEFRTPKNMKLQNSS